MISKIDIKSALLGIIVGISVMSALGAASPGRKPTSWEYRIVSGPIPDGRLQNDINSCVAEGWEFVTVSDMSLQQYAFAVLRQARER